MKYQNFGGEIPSNIKENLTYLKEKRARDFEERLGMGPDNQVCKVLNGLYDSAISGKTVTFDANAKECICKSAGVAMYIVQEGKNNPEFVYSNNQELGDIKSKLEHCKENGVQLPERYRRIIKKYRA